jgi:hypothetical protein
MKTLFQRRDIWIGLTALVLLLVVALQNRPAPHSNRPNVSAPPVATNAVDQIRPPLTRATPRLNTSEAAVLVARWRQTGLPDPMGTPSLVPPASSNMWSGIDALKVSAIWIQPSRRLAVINQRVIAEGEEIAGFRLEHCEPGGVWLAGANGSRRVLMSRSSSPKTRPSNQHPPATASSTATPRKAAIP